MFHTQPITGVQHKLAVQSKLSRDKKIEVREMITYLENFGGRLFHFPQNGMTIAICPKFSGSQFANVGIAWQAPSEKKFRKLVGANLAIERIEGGLTFPVREDQYDEFAYYLSLSGDYRYE